jgi:putative hydrolase of the HAD superfamily
MADLNAVLFDADGVIQLAPDYLHLSLTTALGRAPHERELCMNELFAAERPALVGAAAFETELVAALRRLNASCSVETVIDHWKLIEPHEPILHLVRRLRDAGNYCALASNQERNRARHMSGRLGYAGVFQDEFYSCDLGHTKPSATFFAEIVRRVGLDPARTLFIDDRRDNVEAARACGFRAEQFVLWQEADAAASLELLLQSHKLL